VTSQTPPSARARVEHAFVGERELLLRICFGYLHNAEDAEDAVQEAFARVTAHADAITGDVAAYTKMTARNVCRDVRRRRDIERRAVATASSRERDGGEDPQRVAVDSEELATVLPRLSAGDRTLLALHFAGFSYAEIAARLGRSSTSVSVAITRARQRARRLAEAPRQLGGLLGWVAGWGRRTRLRLLGEVTQPAAPSHCAALVLAVLLFVAAPGELQPASGGGHGSTQAAPAAPSTRGDGGAVAEAASRSAGAGIGGMEKARGNAAVTPRPHTGTVQPGAASRSKLGPTPQSTSFTSVVASPAYAENHTVYASGYSGSCACTAFFASRDSGRSWQLLPGTTLGGSLTLGVLANEDLVIWVDTVGVEVATAQGVPLGPIVPAAAAAVAPDGGQVVLATVDRNHLLLLDGHTLRVVPGPALPRGFHVDALAYAGDPGTLLVSGASDRRGAPVGEQVLGCSALACTPRAALGLAGVWQLVAAPAWAADRETVAAVSADSNAVSVSSDAGETWRPLAFDGPAAAGAVALLAVGERIDVVVGRWTGPTYSVLRFAGGDVHAEPLGGGVLDPWPLYAMAELPDGRLLASVANGPRGLLCSSDGGSTWTGACSSG
jgi:RNA polymerase sigma factor (sigma-70 family)